MLGNGEVGTPVTGPSRPFQLAMMDGHRIDGLFVVSVLTPEGDLVEVILDRPWLLLILEAASRTVLGYYLSLAPELSAADVLRVIKRAVTPWKRRTLTIEGLQYSREGGFASEVLPEFSYAVWDELWVDNAKINLAKKVREQVIDAMGGVINAGPVKTPERRAIIERFFGLLEECNFHRLGNTTGSGPKDPRRINPEKVARRYGMTFEHLLELLDVAIAQYNGTPHGGAGMHFRSPLEYLNLHVQRGGIVRTLPPARQDLFALARESYRRCVRGDVRNGVRPHVNIEGVPYTSDVLAKMPALVGQQLTITINVDDARCARAFLADGSELGCLTAHRYWGVTPHTLDQRRTIMRLRRRKLIHFLDSQDPIRAYHEYLANRSPKDRRAASLHEQLRLTQQLAATDEAVTEAFSEDGDSEMSANDVHSASAPFDELDDPEPLRRNQVAEVPFRAVTF